MVMTKFFRDQLDREVAASRKVLERVPEGRDDWKPHERSMAMSYLAALVAQMPAWIAMMLTTTELNLDDKDARGKFQSKAFDLSASLLHLLGPAGLEIFVQQEDLFFAGLPTHDVTGGIKPDFAGSECISHDRYAKPGQRFLRANRTLHRE